MRDIAQYLSQNQLVESENRKINSDWFIAQKDSPNSLSVSQVQPSLVNNQSLSEPAQITIETDN